MPHDIIIGVCLAQPLASCLPLAHTNNPMNPWLVEPIVMCCVETPIVLVYRTTPNPLRPGLVSYQSHVSLIFVKWNPGTLDVVVVIEVLLINLLVLVLPCQRKVPVIVPIRQLLMILSLYDLATHCEYPRTCADAVTGIKAESIKTQARNVAISRLAFQNSTLLLFLY